MRDASHSGRCTSGLGLSAPRVFLGLLLLASVGAGAQTVKPASTFNPLAGSNQLHTNLVLTFPIPEGFEKADGSALLLSPSGKREETVPGSFKTSLEAKTVTAEFRVRREWQKKTFSAIELEEQLFSFSDAIVVDPILPRRLDIKPEPNATSERVLAFRALSSVALEDEANLCGHSLTRVPAHLGFEARELKADRAGVDVQVEIERPKTKISDAQLTLEICLGSLRWVYTGKLPVLGPEDAPNGPGDPDSGEMPGETPEETGAPTTDDDVATDRGTADVVGPSPFWETVRANPRLSGAIALLLVGLLGVVSYLSYDLWGRRRTPDDLTGEQLRPEPPQAPPPPAPVETLSLAAIASRVVDALRGEITPLKDDIGEVKSILADLREARFYDPLAGSSEAWERRDAGTTGPALSPGGGDGNLSELVNRWWRDGADRDRAALLVQNPFVKAYRSVKIHEDMRNITNRTFTFQVTDGPMEWLGRQQQGDLLLVPCDQRQFEAGDSLKFLGYLFDGLGKSLAKVRFRRVVKPCRLRREPGAQDRYRLVEKGLLELEGQAESVSAPLVVQPVALTRGNQENLPMATGLSEASLTKIIRGAISQVIPGDFSARFDEMAQQARSWPQKSEPTQADPNLIALLDALRQSVAACDGELRAHASALQGVKSLVEALRGDLLRIESEVHRPDPAPAASPASLFTDAKEADLAAAVDRLGEGPAQPLLQESPSDMMASPWRSTEPVHAPEQVLEKLEKWWPARLPAAEANPSGEPLPDPSAYLWRLVQTQSVLALEGQQRGWGVSLVHLSLPEGSAQGDASLQITEPVTVSRDFRNASFPGNSVGDALLYQFALSIHGDAGRHIAILPAAGLRVDRHHHAYSRLTFGKLPGSATRLTQVIQPAILSPVGQGGLYTVVSPLKAEFR